MPVRKGLSFCMQRSSSPGVRVEGIVREEAVVAPALLDKEPMQENSAHMIMLEPSQRTTSGREPTSTLLSAKLVICQTPAGSGKQNGATEDLFCYPRTVRRNTAESSPKLA